MSKSNWKSYRGDLPLDEVGGHDLRADLLHVLHGGGSGVEPTWMEDSGDLRSPVFQDYASPGGGESGYYGSPFGGNNGGMVGLFDFDRVGEVAEAYRGEPGSLIAALGAPYATGVERAGGLDATTGGGGIYHTYDPFWEGQRNLTLEGSRVDATPEGIETGSDRDLNYRQLYEISGFMPRGGYESIYGPDVLKTTYAVGSPQGDLSWGVPSHWGHYAGETYTYVPKRERAGRPSTIGAHQGHPAYWIGGKEGSKFMPGGGDPTTRPGGPGGSWHPEGFYGVSKNWMDRLLENPNVSPQIGPRSTPAPSWEIEEGEPGSEGSWGGFSGGGLIRGYQDGGLADLMPAFEEVDSAEEIVQTPSGVDMFSEVDAQENFSEASLVAFAEEAKSAIRGEHPNADQFLQLFAELFGMEMLNELRQAVEMEGSDGMSDSIPANIDGVEEIAVSEGEYVVPAREVAALGNGSTEAGGRAMDKMVEDIRVSTTGSRGPQPPIDPEELLLKATA